MNVSKEVQLKFLAITCLYLVLTPPSEFPRRRARCESRGRRDARKNFAGPRERQKATQRGRDAAANSGGELGYAGQTRRRSCVVCVGRVSSGLRRGQGNPREKNEQARLKHGRRGCAVCKWAWSVSLCVCVRLTRVVAACVEADGFYTAGRMRG